MKSRFAYVLLFFVGAVAASGPMTAQTATPTADSVAARAFDVAAGPAWDAAHYFAFTFVLERDGKVAATFPQRFDRISGDYRVSGLDPQEKKFEVIMNVNSKKGRAFSEGKELKGEALDKMLAVGYRRYQNDVFWLLMGFKMRDPFVKRTYITARPDACGRTYDVIRPVFESGFGFSQNDQYNVWIDRDTGLIESWDMKLVGASAQEGPVTVLFRDYHRVGGLLVSERREIQSKKQVVRLEELQVLPEPPKGAFE